MDDSPEGNPQEDRPPGPPRQPALAALASRRGLRWGGATAAYVVVVVAVLAAINLIGSRIGGTVDLTNSHQLTLSAASRRIAAAVRQPVHIIAFEQPENPTGSQVALLLKQYAADSHGRITYEVVDPVTHNGLAAQYRVQSYNTVVVQSGTNTQTIQPSDMTTYNAAGSPVFSGETAITNALLRVASAVQPQVDWLAGDGEPDITAGLRPDATAGLTDQGFKVGSLNLLTSSGVPSSVACIVIDSPTVDLSPGEVSALQAFAQRGGDFVVLLQPATKPMPKLYAMLAGWGITPQNDVAIDLTRHYQADPTMVVPNFGTSPITAPIEQAGLATLLPGSIGLTVGHPKAYTVTPVLTTSGGGSTTQPASWGMVNVQALASGNVTYTKGKDIAGPLVLAATTESTSAASAAPTTAGAAAKGFRAVVFGNALFISSGTQSGGQTDFIAVQGNKDLFLNAVSWATGRSQDITVRPNPTISTQVFLTGSSTRTLALSFFLLVPLVCFALGFGTWLSRRRL